MKKFLYNKFVVLLLAFVLLAASTVALSPVSEVNAATSVKEITVFSWEDYIDLGYGYANGDFPSDYLQDNYSEADLRKSVLDIFEEQTGIKVNYYSFATNEEMYNELLKNPDACDLICPSEYMILKMREEGLIKPYSAPDNYQVNGSPYIKRVFNDLGLNTADGKTYAIGYMWGTMGLIYNAEKYSDSDFSHWSNLYDEKFSGKITIKDSLRDSYIMAAAIVYEEELMSLKGRFENGEISQEEYKSSLSDIFNATDPETVDMIGDALIKLKNNLYGFEVDAGKSDLISGKIDVNFAWSGDAVFSMWEADDIGLELGYVVPQEGSNVWFDGWVMTKSADETLALRFLDFISDPKIAVRNMDYIGYTSCMAGDDVFNYVDGNFGAEDDETDLTDFDLSYFFGEGDYTVTAGSCARHLYAQYADEETIMRCAVMNNFSNDDLVLINEMWNKVKLITLPAYALIIIAAIIVLAAVGFVLYKFRDKIFGNEISKEQTKPRRKGYTVVKIEELKR